MICYFDCFSGVSGDMLLGALVDAGVSPERLRKELSFLPIKGYRLKIKAVKRAELLATRVDVVQKAKGSHLRRPTEAGRQKAAGKKWKDIERIIKNSSLSKSIKQKGLAVFRRLFEAEAKVHGERLDKVHLHELGAVDCVVDVFGTVIGLEILGIKKVYSSPLNLGSGTIKTEHGILPVPAPATVELLRNVPVYSSDLGFELTTPTGAAIISTLAKGFGSMPCLEISKIGIGAGNKDFKEQPNVLRIFIGEETENPPSPPFSKGGQGKINEGITIIETNIDDMNPQIYEYIMEKLFKAGALDVFLTQVIMKKGRPGIKLTVLCSNDKKEGLMKILLKETTSIGLRFYEVQRMMLRREFKSVDTKFGKINVKISSFGNDILKVTPEYEDCKKIAKKFNIPIAGVYKEVASKEQRIARKKYKNQDL